MSKIKLFCIPYAGGSAVVYSKWKKLINPLIELKEIELPGRGYKMKEPLLDNMPEMVENIFKEMKNEIKPPYALFGHSMGALITYELYKKLKKAGYPAPVHMFISGKKSPQVAIKDLKLYHLPEDEFIDHILKYNGTNESVFKNKELASLFIPILRADFKIVETYKFDHTDDRLDCDISVFGGTEDRTVDWDDLLQWQEVAKKKCNFYSFKGGHFFINEHTEEVVNQINRIINNISKI
ncbi:thioesterase II family protein [Bacillus chungangensis]|uniref:Surfactin synthase thioesterase subunit n=1 Tax=Bacillus chungangensis TaxID=587633 RepID=A0ABT9WPQ3_9BACI|nr:thioesterase domain-containing protein [Bacillus chungangensis]MDQ0175270.1 surfactin synthase thioesterase subunit [Bacillus chungangensis]